MEGFAILLWIFPVLGNPAFVSNLESLVALRLQKNQLWLIYPGSFMADNDAIAYSPNQAGSSCAVFCLLERAMGA
jgi:hypothetical protein